MIEHEIKTYITFEYEQAEPWFKVVIIDEEGKELAEGKGRTIEDATDDCLLYVPRYKYLKINEGLLP